MTPMQNSGETIWIWSTSYCVSPEHNVMDHAWDLYLYAFKRMLPFFFRYDHVNYARWGSVYIAEMSDLPPEVLLEFQKGNFVVKQSDRRFNQVSADQSTEWLNATGKKWWFGWYYQNCICTQ